MSDDANPRTPSSEPQSRTLISESLAEFLGTFLLVFFGPASVIVTSVVPAIPPLGALVLVALSFGTSVAVAILILRRYSRVYINPAVTLAAAFVGHLRGRSTLPYIGSQILGGLAAGVALWAVFRSFDISTRLGSTRLAADVGPVAGIALEAAGSLVLTLAALVASSKMKRAGVQASFVGGVLFFLILILGPLTGAGLNPARSIGPALASGFLDDVFVYIVGPVAGGLLAAASFLTFEKMAGRKDERLLFVCVENAGRSRIAQAFAERNGLDAESAGTIPAGRVNPTVVEAMRERGLDIGTRAPKRLTPEMIERASIIVTMGCSVEEVCPRPMLAQMQKELVDWDLEDPKGKSLADVRRIRDEIERRVAGLAR